VPADYRRREARLMIACCVLMSVALYAPAVCFPSFAETYVDFGTVNAAHFSARRWLQADGPYYRPAARWLYHVWYVACGGEVVPWLDHAFQIALHAASVGLLFLLLLQQTASPLASAGGALTLAFHPSITGAVVYSSVAWSAVVTFLFLIACNLYQWSLDRLPKNPPSLMVVVAPILLLFLSLVAETGALAVGIVTAWVAVMVLRRDDRRYAVRYLLPLVAVGVAYLTMRKVAVGTFISPYTAVDLALGERLQTYAANLLYDTTILVNPVRISALDVDPASKASVIRAALLCFTIVTGVMFRRRIRAFFVSQPLPTLGLLMVLLFQMMALWLVEKAPIARAGVDRGWVYHVVVALMGLMAGNAIKAVAAGWGRTGRIVLGLGWGAYLLGAAAATCHSVQLWEQGGDILRGHRAALTPFLRGLPEGTALAMQGFPDALRVPYLPWVEVYYYSKSYILSSWARKPLRIYWDTRDSPPPDGFSGYVLENVGGNPRWHREDSRAAMRAYLDHPEKGQSLTLPLVDDSAPGRPGASLFWRGAEARTAGPDLLQIRLLDSDPNVSLKVAIDPLAYGVLRYELRIVSLVGKSAPGTTQVYFRREGQEFDELKSMSREVPGDGAWHELRLPLFQNPRWIDNGAIDALRLDLLDRAGTVELRGLRLENDLAWAREMAARPASGEP
jgi:hypothetical protein